MPEDEKMITVKETDYQGLLAKTVSQATQIEQLKQQLKDSTEALTVIKTRMDAAEKEEKDAVIDELVRDSQGKLSQETLQDHDLKDLYFLKDTLTGLSQKPSFPSCANVKLILRSRSSWAPLEHTTRLLANTKEAWLNDRANLWFSNR